MTTSVSSGYGRRGGCCPRALAPAEVAADAGFADQAHLTRWFRRYYGVTPAAYRAAAGGPAGR